MEQRAVAALKRQLDRLYLENARLKELQMHNRFVLQLRQQRYVRVRLPECDRGAVRTLRNFCNSFFDLELEVKESLGEFRRIHGHLVGFQKHDNREFAELRMDSNGQPSPWLVDSQQSEKDTGKDKFQRCCSSVFRALSKAGNLVLASIAREMGVAPQVFLDVVDEQAPLEGQLTSSVLRVCKYSAEDGEEAQDDGDGIAFGEHTDSSFVTVALCSTVPGLEIQTADGRWITPENAESDILDAVVFVGDFVQLITKNHFRSAVHRVRRNMEHDRLSMPFLMKGRLDLVLDTTKYLNSSGEQERVSCSDPRIDGWSLAECSLDSPARRRANKRSTTTWKMVECSQPPCWTTTQQPSAAKTKEILRLDGIAMKEVHLLLEMRRRRLVHVQRQAERERRKEQAERERKKDQAEQQTGTAGDGVKQASGADERALKLAKILARMKNKNK